jgi:predicted RNase H-like HicB family nuclease
MTPPPPYAAAAYTYRVLWSAEDLLYVGVCVEFPLVIYLAGSHEQALAGIIARIQGVLEHRQNTGESLPTPLSIRLLGERAR